MDKNTIRSIFMQHGFTIKEGRTDLKPYVYEAAEALLSAARAAGMLEAATICDQESVDAFDKSSISIAAKRIRAIATQAAPTQAAQAEPVAWRVGAIVHHDKTKAETDSKYYGKPIEHLYLATLAHSASTQADCWCKGTEKKCHGCTLLESTQAAQGGGVQADEICPSCKCHSEGIGADGVENDCHACFVRDHKKWLAANPAPSAALEKIERRLGEAKAIIELVTSEWQPAFLQGKYDSDDAQENALRDRVRVWLAGAAPAQVAQSEPVAAQFKMPGETWEECSVDEEDAMLKAGYKFRYLYAAPSVQPAEAPSQAARDVLAEFEQDPLYDKAVMVVRALNRASVSLVQRHLMIGYNRASRLLEAMEKAGVVSACSEHGHRTVIDRAAHQASAQEGEKA